MLSRITIEIDFDNGQPYIKVASRQSDDVRDKLVKFFSQRLGHTSSWAKIIFDPQHNSEELIFSISPITPERLRAESEVMAEQVRWLEQVPPSPQVAH